MASNLVRRARQLLGESTHERAKQRVAGQLAREFPAYERHEVWGAVGLGPTEPKPPPLYLAHVSPHEVRTRVDPRPDGAPEHPTDAEATRALRKAGVKRPRRQPPSKPPAVVVRLGALLRADPEYVEGEDEVLTNEQLAERVGRLVGHCSTDAEREASDRRHKAELAAEAAERLAERARRAATTAAHLAARARAEERAVRRGE